MIKEELCRLPKGSIKLSYSEHAMERLKERTTGSLILAPQYIRFTKENTTDIKMQNGKIKEATIFLKYKKGVLMFLPIIVGSGIVKTVFFRYVKKDTPKERTKLIKKESFKENIPTEILGTEIPGEGSSGENVVYVFRDLGGKKNWGKELFRALRGIFRKRT